MTGYFRVSRTYAAWIGARIPLRLLMLALLIEAIFLSQHFVDILELFMADVSSPIDVLKLTLLTAPEINFALPVAVLAAVFFELRECRERRELLILATSGLGTRHILGLATIIGISAAALCLLITSYVVPNASFKFRKELLSIHEASLVSGGASGHSYSFQDQTVFKLPERDVNGKPIVFIDQESEAHHRLIVAESAYVGVLPSGTSIRIGLDNVVTFDIPTINQRSSRSSMDSSDADGKCQNCSQGASIKVRHYERDFELTDLFRLEPRGQETREWYPDELLGLSRPPLGRGAELGEEIEFVNHVAASLTCLLAPFLATLALLFSGRLGQVIALPIACGAILSIAILAQAACRTLTGFGMATALLAIVTAYILLLAGAACQIYIRQDAIIVPVAQKA
jgi:lipopolysaccharide export system permease protein